VIRVVVGDLAATSADAIVRPATVRLAASTAVAERLERAAGPRFHDDITTRRDLAPGAAVVTGAGDLPAEFVVHAVLGAEPGATTPAALTRAWLSVLERAKEWQLEHLAVPPLHPGTAEMSLLAVVDAMVTVLRAHRETASFPVSISFVVESEEDRAVFAAALRQLPGVTS
jgi:O-acetyl-ADP-ribose deacetylase (regulator of RNase III)